MEDSFIARSIQIIFLFWIFVGISQDESVNTVVVIGGIYLAVSGTVAIVVKCTGFFTGVTPIYLDVFYYLTAFTILFMVEVGCGVLVRDSKDRTAPCCDSPRIHGAGSLPGSSTASRGPLSGVPSGGELPSSSAATGMSSTTTTCQCRKTLQTSTRAVMSIPGVLGPGSRDEGILGPLVSPVREILDVMNEAEKIGQAFVTLVLISRQMGHSDIRSTARDYLLPHASADHSPEQLFVLAAVAGPDGGGLRPDELLPDDDAAAAHEALGSMALPPLSQSHER